MKKQIVKIITGVAVATVFMLAPAGTAAAVGGPNEAGNSGKFHPHSKPCDNKNNHTHCPGPR